MTYLSDKSVVLNPSRYRAEKLLELSVFIPFLTLYNLINQKQQIVILTCQIIENYQKEMFNMTYLNLHDKLILRIFDLIQL